MRTRRDTGWRELGASAALHGSLLGLVLAFASATGPGPRLPGAPGSGEDPSGAAMNVFPVALLGGEASGESFVAGDRAPAPAQPVDQLRAAEASQIESGAPSGALEARAATSGRTTGPGAVGPEGEESGSEPGEAAPGGAGGASGSSGGGAGGAPGPGGSDVLPPSPLHIAVPALPRGLDPRRVRGAHVRLLLYVSESGDVSDVKVLSSSGIEKLDTAAESAVRRLRYAPGSRAGSPVAMWTEAEISF